MIITSWYYLKDVPTTPHATSARATAAQATAAWGDGCPPGDNCPLGNNCPRRQLPQLGRGNFVHVGHASPTKKFLGKMLTWVWLYWSLAHFTLLRGGPVKW